MAALKKAQRQLDAAEKHLGSTRGELATAEARDAQMQAELVKSEAELDVAITRLAQGKKELKTSEQRGQQFTVESLQEGDRGLQAFGDLLRGESPTRFSEKMSLSDSVSDAQLATMQRLAASKVILKLNREKVQQLRDQVAAARQAAAANLVRKQELEAAAEDQAEEVDRLVGERAKARNSAAAIKREDEKRLRSWNGAGQPERPPRRAGAARTARPAARVPAATAAGRSRVRSAARSPRRTACAGTRSPASTSCTTAPTSAPAAARPIRAAAAGTIIEQYYNGGYGNRVILNNGIKRGKSVVTTYNHLSRYAKGRGAQVSRGEVIGYVGSTGYSTGCHLHFMVIANGRTTNPMGWLVAPCEQWPGGQGDRAQDRRAEQEGAPRLPHRGHL